MSTTILGGDVTVYFLDENRQQRIRWSGAASGTRTVNELYSALEDLLDEAVQSDDGNVMSGETPVEYTIGKIDTGEVEPWYISLDMIEHLTGGALKTSGWTRVTGTNTGIIVVPVTANAIVSGDEGLDISGATTGRGTLLEVIEAGATDYLVIRPDSSIAGDSFTTAAQVITCNGHTATQSGALSHTGEMIWANLYNVTPIDADTHVYMYQGTVANATRARIGRISNAAGDWWEEGAFDRLYAITNFQAAGFPIIDSGYIGVFARKGNTLYDSFEVSTSIVSGGRNPVPLKAQPDLNHTTGHKSITFTASAGSWNVGDEISGDTSGARGIITFIDTPGATQTVHYYPIGDPQVPFQTAAENVTNEDDTGTGTKNGSAPANQGPALAAWFTSGTIPSIVHSNTVFDIDDDGTAEGWGITIDCEANPLTEVYEWLQHITANGQTGTTNTDGIEGEQYVGVTVFLEYSGAVAGGTIVEGDDVSQAGTGATGVVISHDTVLKQILIRDSRGTFNTAGLVTSSDNAGAITPNIAASTITANTASPFGSFAGGRFFGARGVLLANWIEADENSFQLVDSQGIGRARPIAISLELTNLDGGAESVGTNDLVSLYRLTGSGGVVDKTEYSAAGGEAIGAATLTVDSAIASDVVGKTAGGVLKIRDASNNNHEYRLRYSSWSGSVFTLANIVIAAADGGTNTTTIVEAGAFTNAKRGDLVYNHTRSAVSYVLTVDSANQVTISPAIAAQTTGDSIELNACPIAVNTADDVYVALMDRYATAPAESVSLVYVAPIYYRAKVTNKRNATKIKAFVTADSTSGTDRSIAAIRNTDTIAN
jgi:hypothetical protein